jgi:hypothetical protein
MDCTIIAKIVEKSMMKKQKIKSKRNFIGKIIVIKIKVY